MTESIQIMKKDICKILLFLLLPGIVSACSPFKPKPRVFPADELPKIYSLYDEGTVYSQHWWEEFKDQELNRLIETALSENLTLKEAWARLKQSQAVAATHG